MTDGLTDAMLDPVVDMFLKGAAPKFHEVLNSRDIKKVVRWLEGKYRVIIVPYKRKHPFIAAALEAPVGKKVGKSLGDYSVAQYEAASYDRRQEWNARRWLHHGALGELLIMRGMKKSNLFLIGLGNGLKESDIQDMNDWHTPEYWKAREVLEKMR